MVNQRKYVPFPVGTVRGPYVCGKGTDSAGGIQFLVQTKAGWVPFIRDRSELAEARREAEEYAAKSISELKMYNRRVTVPKPALTLESLLEASPETLWRAWIEKIVRDPDMNTDRTMRHLQEHVKSHIPDADASRERWEEWLAGTYNLLAILSTGIGISPPFTLGNELLLRKWTTAPHDHTPPPVEVKPENILRTRRQREPDNDYSGS